MDRKWYILDGAVVILTILYIIKLVILYPNFMDMVFLLMGLIIILTKQIFVARKFSDDKPTRFYNGLGCSSAIRILLVVKALIFTPLWRHFVLEVHINREGAVARGVYLKVTQAGGATIQREEMEKLAKTYLETLGEYWK